MGGLLAVLFVCAVRAMQCWCAETSCRYTDCCSVESVSRLLYVAHFQGVLYEFANSNWRSSMHTYESPPCTSITTNCVVCTRRGSSPHLSSPSEVVMVHRLFCRYFVAWKCPCLFILFLGFVPKLSTSCARKLSRKHTHFGATPLCRPHAAAVQGSKRSMQCRMIRYI